MNVRRMVCLAVVLQAIGWSGVPAGGQEMTLSSQVIERTLPNGLKVLMVKRPEAPLIRCILAYRVGSVNERPGITGISHFHEHMMFKGTRSMGIKAGMLAKDDEYNRQIDALMEQVAAEESKVKGRDEAKVAALKKQVSELIDKEKKETIVSEEIWSAYQEAGGTGINASTGKEMTQYYVTLPKNAIELYLALEADRMVNPVFREFYSERDVITEERRMSENGAGLLLPGAAECDVLRCQPLFLGGARLDVRHQPGDQAGDDRVPREVLPSGQRDARARRRPRSRQGDAARREVLRADQAEGQVAPRADRGAVAGVLQADDWAELQAAVRREARPGPRRHQPGGHHLVPHSARVARRPSGADHAGPRDERAHREDVHGPRREAAARDRA